MVRMLVVSLCIMSFIGCSSVSKPELTNGRAALTTEDPVFFGSEDAQADRIKTFLEKKSNPDEMEKINYLLTVVRDANVIFYRNQEEYPGHIAARWLRWKIQHRQYRDNPIRTAVRFINEVADSSRQTDLPYEIIFEDGKRVRLTVVLMQELHALEDAVRAKALSEAIQSEGFKNGGTSFGEPLSTPIFLPST